MQNDAAPDKRKVTVLEMRIRIWAPLDPRDPFLGKIGDSPIMFQGPTATAVKRQAEEWRIAEWNKHHPKEQHV